MEAVIADNPDDPQINGMRLALADRYFEEESYQQAFEHYRIVLENDPATQEAARSGTDGLDDLSQRPAGARLESIERAIDLDPSYGEGRFFLGLVQLCGLGEYEAAAAPSRRCWRPRCACRRATRRWSRLSSWPAQGGPVADPVTVPDRPKTRA